MSTNNEPLLAVEDCGDNWVALLAVVGFYYFLILLSYFLTRGSFPNLG